MKPQRRAHSYNPVQMSKEASFSDDKMSPVPNDLTAEAPVDSALYIEPQEERQLLRKVSAHYTAPSLGLS